MKKHVVIFEARGGSDKGKYGYRKDTKSIIDSLQTRLWTAEIIFYSDENRGEIYRHTLEHADAYISRINPGNLKDETGYFQMLRELVRNGIEGLPHPDAMINYGAKNAIERLKATSLVPDDVVTYYTIEEMKRTFPSLLSKGTRVIKQNRGSTGEGIWRVDIDDENYKGGVPKAKTRLKLQEAKDNHIEYKTLVEFTDFCVQYLEGDNGLVLDMPFLPRIVEGEVRVLLLRDEAVNIVHKVPEQSGDAFSATLFSGATYTYDKPENWPELIQQLNSSLRNIQESLGGYDFPLLWTCDFILDTCPSTGNDRYVLGEINASCVGFTTHLELSEDIAEEILNLISADRIINKNWPAFKV